MEANRQRVSDLLDAQVSVSEVMDIVKCSKAMKKTGEGFARKAGSGGHNKIVTDDFLVGLIAEIKADPTRSMRRLAKDLGADLGVVVKPWLDATFPDGNYCWQQDSAPGHKAKTTQKWCQDHLADFWPSHFWPPSSPDCAPLDYGIWGYVESKACAVPHWSVEALKTSVEREWAAMSEDHVRKICHAFRPRLEAMVSAKGGHFKK